MRIKLGCMLTLLICWMIERTPRPANANQLVLWSQRLTKLSSALVVRNYTDGYSSFARILQSVPPKVNAYPFDMETAFTPVDAAPVNSPAPLPNDPNEAYIGSARPLSLVMGCLVAVLALTGLLGWLLNSAWLRSFGPEGATMKVNTALMLLLVGVDLIWAGLAKNRPGGAWLLPGAVLLLALLTLLEYATGQLFGIDQWLFTDPFTNPLLAPPGRPSLLTSGCAACLGAALLLSGRARGLVVGQGLALLVVLLMFGVVLGYIMDIRSFYAFGKFSAITLHTALGLLAAGVGVVALQPQQGLMYTANSPYWGGVIVRYMALYVLVAPPLLTFFYQTSLKKQVLVPETGLPLVLFLFMFITLLLFYQVAIRLNRLDQQSQQQYRQLQTAEQAYKQQADLYRTVFDTALTALTAFEAVRNAEGEIIDVRHALVNQEAVQQSGLPAGQLLGRNLTEVFPGTVASGVFGRWKEIIETGQSQQFELHYTYDGLDNWTLCSGVPAGDGLVISYTNITAQKAAELAARKQTDLLESISGASQTGISAFTALRNEAGVIVDFVYAYRNATALRISGKSAHDTVGQRLLSQFPTARELGLFARYVQVVETGEPTRFDQHYAADGLEGTYSLSVCRWGDGIVVDFNDISVLRRAEREKLQQAEFIETILDNVTCGVMVATAIRGVNGQIDDLLVTAVNKQSMIGLGQTAADVIGQRHTVLYPDALTNGAFDLYVRTIETGEPQALELYYRGDDRAFWADLKAQKLGDGVVATWTDISARKEAEQAVQRQSDFYKNVLDNTLASILAYKAVRNEAGVITDFVHTLANKVAVQMTGMTHEQLIGQSMTTLFPGVRTSGQFDISVGIVESGQSLQQEVHYNYEGYDLWLAASTTPYEDGLLVSYVDITRQKQAELAVKQQNETLQQVVDNTQAGLVLARPERNAQGIITDFCYILTNAFNARLTGRTVADMIGALVGDLFPGWQDSDLFRRFVEVVQTGQPWRGTFPYEAYGMKGWFDGSFSCVDGCILYTYTDVTELKDAELANAQQADLLDGIMNTTPTAIVVHESIRDEAGQIVDFRMTRLNQAAATTFTSTVDQVQHRRISRYFPGLLNTPLFEQYKQAVETGEPVRTDVNWGDEWYDFSVARFGDGFVAAAQNITPVRQYRHQLEVANHELRRSNDNLQSFAYVASHDLQEPLRKLISFANILQTQYAAQLAPEVSDILDRMNGAAERMRLLIQDLLAYSRVGTQQDPVKAVNLTKLIQDLGENELWSALYPNKADLYLGELPTLLADPFQMRQLFQNLLSNALKFCPRGTRPVVSVTSRLVDRAEVPAGLLSPVKTGDNKPAGTFHEIAVTDNGIGFDEKYLDRIFQVFQRLHGRNHYAGSGIGLAICQKIVERHNGAITASSKPGEGSTFRVFLPAKK